MLLKMYKLILKLKIFYLIFFLLIPIIAYSDNLEIKKDMVVMGSNEAAVKIKIFSSLTCPHCANFHTEVVSQIKKDVARILTKINK